MLLQGKILLIYHM